MADAVIADGWAPSPRVQHGHRMRLTEFGKKVLAVALPYADQLASEPISGPGRDSRSRATARPQ
jgi:hypothetical protein